MLFAKQLKWQRKHPYHRTYNQIEGHPPTYTEKQFHAPPHEPKQCNYQISHHQSTFSYNTTLFSRASRLAPSVSTEFVITALYSA